MNLDSRIFVAGDDTLVGAALLELLPERGFAKLVGADPWGTFLTCPNGRSEHVRNAHRTRFQGRAACRLAVHLN
jgi:hypothetical protein